MKRIILAALLAIPFVKVHADEPRIPFMDTSHPDRIMYIGVYVGDGASSITQNYSKAIPSIADFSLTPGNIFSIGATAVIPVRNFFGIGTGIDLTINNNYWAFTTLESGAMMSLYTSNHYYALDVPVFLDFRFNISNNVKWENEIGGYIDFGLGGTTKTRSFASYTNSLGQNQVTETVIKRDYYNDSDAIVNSINNLDWGFHLGTGLIFNDRFSLKTVFHAGARDVARNFGVLNVTTHTLGVTFKAGYIF